MIRAFFLFLKIKENNFVTPGNQSLTRSISIIKNAIFMDLLTLVQQCNSNHPNAQRILYDTYYNRWLILCSRYINDSQLVEEVLCNGFLKIFKNLPTAYFISEGQCINWMKQIMINECLMQLRKKKIRYEDIDTIDETFTTEYDPLQQLSLQQILKLIQQLPDGYKTVFNLYTFEQLPHKEIAALLEISEQTSKTQLFKAKRHLQTALKALGYGS